MGALFLLSAGIGAQTPSPPLTQVPLLDCSGLPCVDLAAGDGKTIRLLIDLGAANSYLDAKAAQNLGLQLQPLKANDGTDITQIQQTVVPGAHLGDAPLGDFPFMVLDTSEPQQNGQKAQSLPADGALTYRAFQNRMLQLDYPNHLIRISAPLAEAQACPQKCGDLAIKHVGSSGPPTLTTTGFSINGQPVEAQLDTLFSGTMLVYPGAVEKLALKKQSKAKHKEFFPYIQGGLKLARAEGATESFYDVQLMQDAPLYFGTSDAHVPNVQFDATVGTDLLRRGVVTFDFKGMHMWIEAAGGLEGRSSSHA